MVAGLALSGCAMSAPQNTTSAADIATSAPADRPEGSTGEGSSAPSTNVIDPGAVMKMGSWASYEYTGSEKQKAIIAARLVSIDEATTAQYELLVKQIPQLAGYTIWLVKVEQKKVSGDSIVFNTDSMAFAAIDGNTTKVQQVVMVGWDECTVESFTKRFDDGDGTITQCIIGATQPDESEVVGVQYAAANTRYDSFDGNPIYFVK